MTTTTAPRAPRQDAAAPARRGIARPSLGRLTLVELRKMTDTRAGFWLLLATFGIAVALDVIVLLAAPAEDQTLMEFFSSSVELTSVLLPVLGILAVTSEWSQRTALTTFTLVPERERVIAAKILAAIGLALLAVVVCLQAAVVANALAPVLGDADASWSFSLSALGTHALYGSLAMVGGVAIGLALMSSAPAIVLSFLLPTVFAIVAELITGFRGTAEWLDTSQTLTPLAENAMTGEAWAQLATSMALWIGVPMAIGLVRLRRRELA
jgi:ABC-2 type transport system permease protein